MAMAMAMAADDGYWRNAAGRRAGRIVIIASIVKPQE